MTDPKTSGWKWWALAGLLVATVLGGVYYFTLGSGSAPVNAQEVSPEPRGMPVDVVVPIKGGTERTTTQPGTVLAFESARLYAGASGYLAVQTVDIGSPVHKGQLLAKIAVPDLDKQVQQAAAVLAQSRARVLQMQAHTASALAEVESAKAAIVQAEATKKSAHAQREFRGKQYGRMKALYAKQSIEERLVDEAEDHFTASVEAENAATAAISTTQAQKAAAVAKVEQAKADVAEAEAQVGVSQAQLDKARVMVQFATILSPYDGVITQRSQFPGDYVRAANEGGAESPLLTVHRTDKMRVVVQVPDRDVTYADPGDPAIVAIDALPKEHFHAKVSRIGHAEDPQTRTMRVEIDLENPSGKLTEGMYGRATIILDPATDQLSIPSSCLVGGVEDGKAYVYVVRDNRAIKVGLHVGRDNGLRIAIHDGLTAKDAVVNHPPGDLTNGTLVSVTPESHSPAGASVE